MNFIIRWDKLPFEQTLTSISVSGSRPTPLAEEEVPAIGPTQERAPHGEVVLDHRQRRGHQRHQPRLRMLTFENNYAAPIQVHRL